MELIERDSFLHTLHTKFDSIRNSDGHCLLLSGEAGIGKTSLVRVFCNEVKNNCKILQGTCDALFTPRPLAPLYDIIWQMHGDGWEGTTLREDRAALFNRFFHEISS